MKQQLKERDSITDEDEIALNILSRKLLDNVHNANGCGISNMEGFCRTCREHLADLIHEWAFVHRYGIKQIPKLLNLNNQDVYLDSLIDWNENNGRSALDHERYKIGVPKEDKSHDKR
tara:strand:- start:777 stop:1130 length:354 start_codon:yes stop_codon:yes gene_type:complete